MANIGRFLLSTPMLCLSVDYQSHRAEWTLRSEVTQLIIFSVTYPS